MTEKTLNIGLGKPVATATRSLRQVCHKGSMECRLTGLG